MERKSLTQRDKEAIYDRLLADNETVRFEVFTNQQIIAGMDQGEDMAEVRARVLKQDNAKLRDHPEEEIKVTR